MKYYVVTHTRFAIERILLRAKQRGNLQPYRCLQLSWLFSCKFSLDNGWTFHFPALLTQAAWIHLQIFHRGLKSHLNQNDSLFQFFNSKILTFSNKLTKYLNQWLTGNQQDKKINSIMQYSANSIKSVKKDKKWKYRCIYQIQ